MRVVLVGDYPLDPNRIQGGPQAVFHNLLGGLEQFEDLELYVVTAHKSLEHLQVLRRNGVTFYYLPYPRMTTFLAFPPLMRSIHRILHQIKPDLVHGQSAYVFGCIALSAGYPAILTLHSIHGTEARFAERWVHRWNISLQHTFMYRYFTSHVRHIVSISPYIRQHYEPHVDAIFYDVDNPVEDSFFALDPSEEIPGQILFVGWLRACKRPNLALEAFARARKKASGLSLWFAGAAIDPGLEAQLHDFVARHDLGAHVKFLGQLPEVQLLKAYQQASVLLLTSKLETSPMAIEQAMAAGKPVVSTAVGGIPFLLDHCRTGFLVRSSEPEQIAQALATLAQDSRLRRQIGQAARDEAIRRFKAEVVATRMRAIYYRILEDS